MSRTLGFCVVLGDAATTIAALLNSSGALLIAVFSVLASVILATTSSAIRSILWPTYFWDEPELARVVVPKRRE